jgi:hypothetical protein
LKNSIIISFYNNFLTKWFGGCDSHYIIWLSSSTISQCHFRHNSHYVIRCILILKQVLYIISSLIPIWICFSLWEFIWHFLKVVQRSHHNVWCISFQTPPLSHISHVTTYMCTVSMYLSPVYFVYSPFCWCFPSIASLLVVRNGVLRGRASTFTIQNLQDARESLSRSCTKKQV